MEKEKKYVYVNHNNRCVLVGTSEMIAKSFEDWDEQACPQNDNDYFLAEVDRPEEQICFWDIFKQKVFARNNV